MATLPTVVMTAIFMVQGVPEKASINTVQFQNIEQCNVFMSQELRDITDVVGMDTVDGVWHSYPAKWVLVNQTPNSIQIKSGRYNLKIRCVEIFP